MQKDAIGGSVRYPLWQNKRGEVGIMTRKSKNSTRLGTRSLHLMILPSLILLIIYRYLPMIGIVIAFQDFNIGL